MASRSETKAPPVAIPGEDGRGLSRSTFAVFRQRPFALLWGNTITFALSQAIQQFTFTWLAIDIAGDDGVALWSGFTAGPGTVVGLVLASLGLPILFFGLYAGILTDRLDRRAMLFGTQLGGIALTSGAAALVATGTLNIWGIFGLASVLGCITAFGMPVRQSIVPSLVTPERILNAVTLMNVSAMVAQSGAAVSGAVMELGGFEAAFAMQAGVLTVGLFALIPLRVPDVRVSAPRRIGEDLREGVSFVIRHPGIRTLMIALLATSLVMGGAFQALLPKIAREDMGAGPFEAAMLMTIMLVGTLTTAVVLASRQRVDRAGFYFLWTLIAGGVLNVSLGLAPWYFLAMLIMFITGWNAGFFMNLNLALIQAHTPNAIMGRVMSIYQMCMMGAMPIGALIAGAMADVVGAREWFAACGAGLFLLGVAIITTQPALRGMGSAPEPERNAAATISD